MRVNMPYLLDLGWGDVVYFLPKEISHNELHRTKKHINHHYLPLEFSYALVEDEKYPQIVY